MEGWGSAAPRRWAHHPPRRTRRRRAMMHVPGEWDIAVCRGRSMIPYIRVPRSPHRALCRCTRSASSSRPVSLLGTSVTARRAERRGYDVVKLNLVHHVDAGDRVLRPLARARRRVFYHWQDEVEHLPWSRESADRTRCPGTSSAPWLGLESPSAGSSARSSGSSSGKYLEVVDGKPRLRERPQPCRSWRSPTSSSPCLPLGWPSGRAGCSPSCTTTQARAACGRHPPRRGVPLLCVPRLGRDAHDLRPDETVTRLWFIELIHGPYGDARFDLGLLEWSSCSPRSFSSRASR